MPSLWRQNCICRTPHPISMKNFEGHRGIKMVYRKKFNDIVSHVIRQLHFVLFFLTFKNLWSGWTDRGETLHVWLPMHEERNVHTYHIIGHLVWQPYWIYPKMYLKKKSPERLDRSRRNFTQMFPKPWGYQSIHE